MCDPPSLSLFSPSSLPLLLPHFSNLKSQYYMLLSLFSSLSHSLVLVLQHVFLFLSLALIFFISSSQNTLLLYSIHVSTLHGFNTSRFEHILSSFLKQKVSITSSKYKLKERSLKIYFLRKTDSILDTFSSSNNNKHYG